MLDQYLYSVTTAILIKFKAEIFIDFTVKTHKLYSHLRTTMKNIGNA